jgi:hypothetical protein
MRFDEPRLVRTNLPVTSREIQSCVKEAGRAVIIIIRVDDQVKVCGS